MLFLPLKPSMVSIALKIELAIFEVTDIKLDLAVQPPATHLLTHHSAGTLSPVSHKHHSVLPWGLLLLSMFQKDPLLFVGQITFILYVTVQRSL